MVDFLLPPSGSRRGTIPTDDLVTALQGELGGGSPSTFLYDSSALESPQLGITVFNSFTDLADALAAQEAPTTVVIRQPETIPAGDYSLLQNVTFEARAGERLALTLADGVDFGAGRGFTLRDIDLRVENTSGAAPFGDAAQLFFERATVTAANPLLTGGEVTLRDTLVYGEGYGLGAGGRPFAAIGGGIARSLGLGLYGASAIDENAYIDDADGTVSFKLTGAQSVGAQSGTAGSVVVEADPAAASLQAGVAKPGGAAALAELQALLGEARLGPWRYSAAQTSNGGTYAASDRERVLLGVGAITFTVHLPLNAPIGARVALKSLLAGGGGSGLVTLTFASATSDVIEDASSPGNTAASISWIHGSSGGEAIEYERFPDGVWRIVARIGS